MVFSGITFLYFFLPLFFLLYAIAPNRFRNLVLLIGSIIFYAWGAPKFVFILLASTAIDYFLVLRMHRSEGRLRKRLLSLSIVLNLGLLVYFKYMNFFVDNVNSVLMGLNIGHLNVAEIALPIGISFYTFQTLTYSMDIYRKQNKPLNSVTDYMLYIMMFPQLIAGPIVRYGLISEEIRNREFKSNQIVDGFIRFSVGLAKKVIIANTMAETADVIFAMSPGGWTSTIAWVGILAYTFQIYFDFAGYSDMAIGLGKMMGFRFPENFESPYTSASITEFWRRWHITLGSFMRDYLYIPLGGSRKSTLLTYRNLFVVFLLSGLWHGASWNFILWGAFHGFFLVTERLIGLSKTDRARWIRIPLTFFIVVIGWVVFRIEETEKIGLFYRALFDFSGTWPIQVFNTKFVVIGLIGLVFSFITLTKIGQHWSVHFFTQAYTNNSLLTYFSIAVVLFILSSGYLATGAFNPFIYFRF